MYVAKRRKCYCLKTVAGFDSLRQQLDFSSPLYLWRTLTFIEKFKAGLETESVEQSLHCQL